MAGVDFSLINRSVAVLESNGLLWNFETTPDSRFVCRYSLDGGKKWSEEKLLVTDFSGEFNLTFDSEDNLHLACINRQGKLFYYNWLGNAWNKQGINTKGLVQSVYMAINKEKIDLVYLSFSDGVEHSWSLNQARYDGIHWSEEITIVSGEGHYYNKGVLCYDNESNLHLIYRYYDADSYQLFYSRMDPVSCSWQTAVSLGPHADNTTPCLLSDENGDLHFVYTISDGTNLRTTYRKKNRVSGWLIPEWTLPYFLSPAGHNAYSPTLIIKNSQILALWQQVDGIYRRLSTDYGEVWGEIYHDYNFDDIVNLTPYKPAKSREENIKISSFGTVTSTLPCIVASHLAKEELFSPTPSEIGNHLIFQLKDELKYMPKGMKLFVNLMNNHLQSLMSEVIRSRDPNMATEKGSDLKINYGNALNELTSLRIQLEESREQLRELKEEMKKFIPAESVTELNKQIDKLREHSGKLTEKLNDMYLKIETKDNIIMKLEEKLAAADTNDKTAEDDSLANILYEKISTLEGEIELLKDSLEQKSIENFAIRQKLHLLNKENDNKVKEKADDKAEEMEEQISAEEPAPITEETPIPEETISEETVSEETVSEETVSEETVSEETVSEETVSEETVSEETVSEETISEETTAAEITETEAAVEEPAAISETVADPKPLEPESTDEEVPEIDDTVPGPTTPVIPLVQKPRQPRQACKIKINFKAGNN